MKKWLIETLGRLVRPVVWDLIDRHETARLAAAERRHVENAPARLAATKALRARQRAADAMRSASS